MQVAKSEIEGYQLEVTKPFNRVIIRGLNNYCSMFLLERVKNSEWCIIKKSSAMVTIGNGSIYSPVAYIVARVVDNFIKEAWKVECGKKTKDGIALLRKLMK